MKKYNIREFAMLITIMVFLYSCSEDKGNYDYIELNDVEISGIDENYTVEQFSTLSISPNLTFNLDENEDMLEYLWYIYPSKRLNSADTLSFERNLNVKVESVPETYIAVYKVTNKETGVFYSTDFEIQINGVLTNGLFVLSEINNNANISMINENGKVYQDIYFSVNGESAGTNPVSIADISNRYDKGVLVMCNDEQGGSIVNPYSFAKNGIYSDMFWINQTMPKPVCYIPNGRNEYLITENSFFNRDMMAPPPVKFGTPFVDHVNFVPSLVKGNSFYDNKNKQFIEIGSFSAGLVQNMPDSIFNPADIGMHMLAGGDGYKGDFYGIFYNEELNVHQVLIASYTNEYYSKFIPARIVDITSTTDIEKAKSIVLSTLSPQFFYAIDNKLYCLNAETDITKLVYSFDSNVHIDHIELEKTDNDRTMYIGTSSAEEGKAGTVYVMNVELNGSVAISETYKNIAGRIVDFMYK